MNSKKIANIVFYNSFDENGVATKKATIFYKGGLIKNVTYAVAIDACEELVNELGIKSKNAFKEMINKSIIHVTTEKAFMKEFDRYTDFGRDSIEEALEEIASELEKDKMETDKKAEESEKVNIIDDGKTNVVIDDTENTEEINAEDINDLEEEKEEKPSLKNRIINFFTEPIDNGDDEEEEEYEITEDEEEEKEGLLTRINNKIKESRLGRKIAAIGLVGALIFGAYSCSQRKTKEGQMRTTDKSAEVNNDVAEDTDTTLTITSNKEYNNYSYSQLLEVTKNETQKSTMKNTYGVLKGINVDFANAHKEKIDGIEIKTALSFDEIMALQVAYNDYSKDQIKAIFNGSEINADKMSKDYRAASLQLMGAYVIETPENSIDLSSLLTTQEGKDFYNKYNKLFLAAKTANGKDQLNKVKAFYDAVRADFPITEEVRTEGIAHKEAYDQIESYKLSVTPMIAAAETMFQNLEVDYTLQGGNDCCKLAIGEINFINDIGLCNYAYDEFERIENITQAAETDYENPLYEQYRNAIIKEMQANNAYVIDDAHRELTKLSAFQKAVNGHFEMDGSSYNYSGNGYSQNSGGTYTTTETTTWTESHTEYTVEEERVEKEIPEDEKDKIDDEIEERNKREKEKAEKEAEEERKRLQEEEDKKKEEIEKEIKEEEEDLQEKIEDANEKIEDGKTVNEDDFGDHDVDFDDEHSDENGNLDDSVENITTDPTGDQTGEPLPDPNETGAEFDNQGNTIEYEEVEIIEYEEPTTPTPVVEDTVQPRIEEPIPVPEPIPTPVVESVDEGTYTQTEVYDDIEIEYEVPVISYEEAVDEYVESLANEETEEEAYQLHK